MLIAGTASWWACTLLGQSRPLFAVLVPLVAMGDDPFGALNVSLTRVVGVFVGVFLGIGLLQLDLPSTVLVALLWALSLGAGLVLRPHSAPVNNQVAITALFMLYLGVAARAETVGRPGSGRPRWVPPSRSRPRPCCGPRTRSEEARERVERLHGWLREDLATGGQPAGGCPTRGWPSSSSSRSVNARLGPSAICSSWSGASGR